MKTQSYTHLFSTAAIAFCLTLTSAHADETATPSAEELSKLDTKLEYRTETIYESSFLPGVRFCEEDEVDYRGDFRKVNCQDERLINSVSTREEDPYNTRPNIIVNDRIEPNGNLLRIKFHRKVYTKPNTSEN